MMKFLDIMKEASSRSLRHRPRTSLPLWGRMLSPPSRRPSCSTYGVESRFVEAVPVTEIFRGETVWSGIVHVFDLIDHPQAPRAYVWAEPVDGVSLRQTVKVILHAGPVESPVGAVRASIVKEYREREGEGEI
jgi:hypothetical protein